MAPDKFLREDHKLTKLITEQCIYIYIWCNKDGSEYFLITVYVHGLVIAGTNQKINRKFNKTDYGLVRMQKSKILKIVIVQTNKIGYFCLNPITLRM